MRPGVKKIREDLHKPVEDIDYGLKTSKFIDSKFPQKSLDDFKKFMRSLNQIGSDAAIIRHYCDGRQLACTDCKIKEVPDAVLLNKNLLLQQLFKTEYEEMELQAVRAVASGVHIQVTYEEIRMIEERTRAQSDCVLWYWVRTGRITASVMKQCLKTSIDAPPEKQTLLRKICYPQDTQFTSVATSYGKQNEEQAKRKLKEIFKNHTDVVIQTDCGMLIYHDQPYIAASPDSIVHCSCCGKCTIEIKCPYRLSTKCHLNRQLRIADLTTVDSPFIRHNDVTHALEMVETHDYYFQVQTQIFTSGADYGVFLVWSSTEYIAIRVPRDELLWNQCTAGAKLYFERIILPELLGNCFSRVLNKN